MEVETDLMIVIRRVARTAVIKTCLHLSQRFIVDLQSSQTERCYFKKFPVVEELSQFLKVERGWSRPGSILKMWRSR